MSISLAKASGSAEMLSQHKVPPDSRVELCVLFFILPLKGSSFLLSLFLLSATLNPLSNRITDFITERERYVGPIVHWEMIRANEVRVCISQDNERTQTVPQGVAGHHSLPTAQGEVLPLPCERNSWTHGKKTSLVLVALGKSPTSLH